MRSRRITAEGVTAFLLWFAGAAATVIGVTTRNWGDCLIGVLCIIAGEITYPHERN